MTTLVKNKNWKPSCKRGELAFWLDWAECGCGNSVQEYGFQHAIPNKKTTLQPHEQDGNGKFLVCFKCGRYAKLPTQAQYNRHEKDYAKSIAETGWLCPPIIRKVVGKLSKTQLAKFYEEAESVC